MTNRTLPILAVVSLAATGCFAPDKKVQNRTATEQQVVAASVQRAVDRLVVDPAIDPARFTRGVVLRVAAASDVDRELIASALERRLHLLGIPVVGKQEDASHILEATVSFAGSDTQSSLIGIPIVIPGLSVSLGDVSIYKSSTQNGRARIGLQIWDANARLLDVVPEKEASAFFKNETFLTFIGTFVATDLDEWESPSGGSVLFGDGRL